MNLDGEVFIHGHENTKLSGIVLGANYTLRGSQEKHFIIEVSRPVIRLSLVGINLDGSYFDRQIKLSNRYTVPQLAPLLRDEYTDDRDFKPYLREPDSVVVSIFLEFNPDWRDGIMPGKWFVPEITGRDLDFADAVESVPYWPPPIGKMYTTRLANIRNGPGTNYKVLGQHNIGEELIVREQQGNWLIQSLEVEYLAQFEDALKTNLPIGCQFKTKQDQTRLIESGIKIPSLRRETWGLSRVDATGLEPVTPAL